MGPGSTTKISIIIIMKYRSSAAVMGHQKGSLRCVKLFS
jgi:hypothetical protein